MFFHQQTKSLVLQADDPLSIRSALPRWSRIIGQTEQGNVQVRHNIETTRILRNMGYDAPSPMDCHYPWPGKYDPYDHQRVMADAMIMNQKVFNLSEMGTGKTYASLWAADYLMSQGLVKRALILSPLSTLETVWKQDIFDILMHRSCAVIHGSMEKRLQRLNTDVDFYILNHDGIALPEVAKLIRRRTDIDLIICDEFHYFINNNTDKWKYLNWVMEKKDRLWGMTGTPTPNEPTDAWALCKLINPNAVPRFKGTFKRQTMLGIGKWKWAPRKGSERIVFDVMRPAVRFLKKDCLDLPEQIGPIKIQTRMTKAQEKAYNQMREDMILSGQGTVITAVNAADKITKLRQILCGVVKDPTTGQYKFINHHHRIDDLCATIDQAKAKVLVIVPFKGILRALDAELTKRGYSTAFINGDVSPGARDKIIRAFKTTDDPQVLLCHPMVMAHGLNLTVADMTIFYAPIYSNKDYQQVTERNNRAGQTRVTTVVRMGANPLEWQIYRQLDTKGVTQDNVLSLYHRIVGSG